MTAALPRSVRLRTLNSLMATMVGTAPQLRRDVDAVLRVFENDDDTDPGLGPQGSPPPPRRCSSCSPRSNPCRQSPCWTTATSRLTPSGRRNASPMPSRRRGSRRCPVLGGRPAGSVPCRPPRSFGQMASSLRRGRRRAPRHGRAPGWPPPPDGGRALIQR